MDWFWYVAQPNEIFVDVDRVAENANRISKRVDAAVKSGRLPLKQYHIFNTSENKQHLIFELTVPMFHFERIAWSLVFHSDVYRAACTLMRISKGVGAADLLIGKREYHRPADAVCHCPSKHTAKIMEICPVARKLRGPARAAGYFGPFPTAGNAVTQKRSPSK